MFGENRAIRRLQRQNVDISQSTPRGTLYQSLDGSLEDFIIEAVLISVKWMAVPNRFLQCLNVSVGHQLMFDG